MDQMLHTWCLGLSSFNFSSSFWIIFSAGDAVLTPPARDLSSLIFWFAWDVLSENFSVEFGHCSLLHSLRLFLIAPLFSNRTEQFH